MKNKIAFIIPYFGSFPIWIELFLYSCSRNDFIDFYIYTDCDIPNVKYKNVYYREISFAEYCAKASSVLGVKFYPTNPYKLVDLKPFLGLVHAEEIDEYEYWGFGDLDLVYGDLRKIINNQMLKRYDLISTHADRVAGHFCVIKKNSKYTNFGMSFKNKLEDEYIYGLDEDHFSHMVYPAKKYLWWLYQKVFKRLNVYYIDFFSIPNKFFNLLGRRYINECYTTPPPKDNETWVYNLELGKVETPARQEIPYLHFLFFKKTPFWTPVHYWKDDFWQVETMDYANAKGYICFDNQKVMYVESL